MIRGKREKQEEKLEVLDRPLSTQDRLSAHSHLVGKFRLSV